MPQNGLFELNNIKSGVAIIKEVNEVHVIIFEEFYIQPYIYFKERCTKLWIFIYSLSYLGGKNEQEMKDKFLSIQNVSESNTDNSYSIQTVQNKDLLGNNRSTFVREVDRVLEINNIPTLTETISFNMNMQDKIFFDTQIL